MLDRYFTVHEDEDAGGYNLACFDHGCPVGGGFYPFQPSHNAFPDEQTGGFFHCIGKAAAVLDGRSFMNTGSIP